MLTMKKLNEKLKEIEQKIPITIEHVNYIARKHIYTKDKNYEKEKQNLINRGFQLIKTEDTNTLLCHIYGKTGIKETWEKEYAEGGF